MEIVNTTKRRNLRVCELATGDVYRQVDGSTDICMVVRTPAYTSTTPQARYSVSLTTGEIIPWNGHQNKVCVRLKAKLEVSEEV